MRWYIDAFDANWWIALQYQVSCNHIEVRLVNDDDGPITCHYPEFHFKALTLLALNLKIRPTIRLLP